MSEHDPLEPLDPDIAALVDRTKGLDRLPTGAGPRILASLATRIAFMPPDGGGGPGGTGGAPAAGSAAVSTLGPIVGPALMVVASFLAGVAVGATVRRAPPPGERLVYVDRPAPPSSTVPAPVLPRVAPAAEASRAPASAAARSTPATDGDRLEAENTLLSFARKAIASGDGQRALDAVGRHAAEFPDGLLAEEREALAVRALLLVGRDGQARARAQRFAAAYPESLFLPTVRAEVDAGR